MLAENVHHPRQTDPDTRKRAATVVSGKPDPFTPLAPETFVPLTTVRRDGTPVGTPVNIAVDGDRAYVQAGRETAKVGRILRNGQVTVAPSTARGRATGPTTEATPACWREKRHGMRSRGSTGSTRSSTGYWCAGRTDGRARNLRSWSRPQRRLPPAPAGPSWA